MNRYFSVTIPLSIVMGFFEDYKNFVYRVPQKLVFFRNTGSQPNNCLRMDSSYSVQIILNEVVWRLPQIKFSI